MASLKEIAASISDAEVEVLQQLWKESPLAAQDIIDRLESTNSAHPKTVKTLINRLLNKGAIKFKEENRKYSYYPVVKKKDFYGVKTESFLNKFFAGELSPLVSFFSNHKKLSAKEIAEIRKLLDAQEAGHDD
jgi:BlaI family transcriptional regulator, penicillinase repressor